MLKDKGFTLIELLATIIVISLILILVVTTFTKTIDNTKQQAYRMQISNLEVSAKKWAVDNSGLLSETTPYFLPIEDLITDGYIKDTDIIDPRTNNNITGCIKILFDEAYNQFEYNYTKECS